MTAKLILFPRQSRARSHPDVSFLLQEVQDEREDK